jgi:uncharacterized protein YdaU (DUF1376 family)
MQAPYFPLYSKDTLAEVSWMSNEEAGAWLRLQLQAWEQEPKGTLPNNDELLMRFAQSSPSKWQEIKLAAMFGFTLGEDDRWHNAKLESAFQDVVDGHRKRQDAASQRWNKRTASAQLKQSRSNANAMHKQSKNNASAKNMQTDAKQIQSNSIADAMDEHTDAMHMQCISNADAQHMQTDAMDMQSNNNADAMDMQSISNADALQCYSDADADTESKRVSVEREGGTGGKPQKARSPGERRPTLCDDDFLASLQAREVYSQLNVRKVYGKMCTWCELKGKVPTRARLVNWLNREDVPMESKPNGTAKPNGAAPSGMVY